eukprot:jgi/Psemu1/38607/gm1.38607_g
MVTPTTTGAANLALMKSNKSKNKEPPEEEDADRPDGEEGADRLEEEAEDADRLEEEAEDAD